MNSVQFGKTGTLHRILTGIWALEWSCDLSEYLLAFRLALHMNRSPDSNKITVICYNMPSLRTGTSVPNIDVNQVLGSAQ